MAFEIIGSIAQVIGEVAFAIRYGKSRTTLPNISLPVACITFLFFGLFIGIFSFVSIGFQLSGWLAFIYAGFFIAGIASAVYLASTL